LAKVVMKNKVILNIILDEWAHWGDSERREISGASDHLVKTHFLTVGLLAATLGSGCLTASSSALSSGFSVGVTVIVTTTTATLASAACGWANFFISIFFFVFLISPILLLLLLYLLQSFQSLFILVFVLFGQGKILLRLQQLVVFEELGFGIKLLETTLSL